MGQLSPARRIASCSLAFYPHIVRCISYLILFYNLKSYTFIHIQGICQCVMEQMTVDSVLSHSLIRIKKKIIQNLEISVGKVPMLRPRFPGRERKFFSSTKRLDQLCGPPN